jgi:tripartite-type tricarboxylate transporter receptor subunit TctC
MGLSEGKEGSMRIRIWLVAVLIIGWVGIDTMEIRAQQTPAEQFYKSATIKFIVPYDAGDYDIFARMLAPSLEKHTGAKVLVENMPGASGLVGGGYLYNLAKPDGLTIGIMPVTGMVVSEMLGVGGVKYEMDKFTYIGRVAVEHRAVFASKASGIKSIEDMQKAPKTIRFGTTNFTAHSAVNVSLLIEAFGLKAKIIPGYKGNQEYILAVMAGRELDAMDTSLLAYEEEGKREALNLVAISGKHRFHGYPDVPTVMETPSLKPEGKKYIDLINALHDLNRMILAPPGVSDDKRVFLEKAVSASLKEQAVLDLAKKYGFNLSHLNSKESKELISKLIQIVPSSERSRFKYIMTEKYY